MGGNGSLLEKIAACGDKHGERIIFSFLQEVEL